MSWQIREVDPAKVEKQVGDAWQILPAEIKMGADGRSYWYGYRISMSFEVQSARQNPIAVVLPSAYGGIHFCVDSDWTDADGSWTVSGHLPNLTLSPSVNLVGIYHGWIQNGVISDDCEGRKF